MNTPTGSKSFQKRNPHLFGGLKEFMDRGMAAQKAVDALTKPPRRIRQSTKPLNKLEREWFDHISSRCQRFPRPRAQAVTFRLANGVTYCPDFYATEWPIVGESPGPVAWEVKGKRAWDDAIVKIKVAAHEWPEIHWYLVWKDDSGTWQQQAILP